MTTVRLWIPDQVRDDERGERTTAPRPKVAIFNLLIRFGHREAATGDVGEWFGRKWDGIAHFRLGARCGRAFDGLRRSYCAFLSGGARPAARTRRLVARCGGEDALRLWRRPRRRLVPARPGAHRTAAAIINPKRSR